MSMPIPVTVDEHFAALPITPAAHFRLLYQAAMLRVLHQVSRLYDTWEAMFDDFPFLAVCNNDLIACGLKGAEPSAAERQWMTALADWESQADSYLPLSALRSAAGLTEQGLILLMMVGLLEEDGSFGGVFEALQGAGQPRPTLGLLTSLWGDDAGETRSQVRQLIAANLLRVVNPEAPRGAWALEVPPVLWDVLSGSPIERLLEGVIYTPIDRLPDVDDLILPAALHTQINTLPALLAGDVQTLIIRGPANNGRRTLMRAVARQIGRSSLEIDYRKPSDSDISLIGALATALGAMPIFICDLMPGEGLELPPLLCYHDAQGVVLGMQGGLRGASVDNALTLTLSLPNPEERCAHWLRALRDVPAEFDAISERCRLTSGSIYRVAWLARANNALTARHVITLADVRQAASTLNRQGLESMAVRETPGGSWSDFAVNAETMSDLRALERRCRYRERLPGAVGTAFDTTLNAGVRAMFSGPSGTGKTLAARLLAGTLDMELYRIDLGAVVNKYIGETEKNLNGLFSRAEELDVILLIDEGDALMTRRTDVHNANDRYANLETNFLLQRLENYSGIVIVTTNAGSRIDQAFQRRMDTVIEFRLPDPRERAVIWRLHLPEHNAVDPDVMNEIAIRCALTGGQIRNAALYASLMALDSGKSITSAQVVSAVYREYRKSGDVCPLRAGKG